MQAEVLRLGPAEGERLRSLRLRALLDAPDAFASTHAETAGRPPSRWREQVEKLPTFVAVREGVDVGMVRGNRDTEHRERAWLLSMWVAPEVRGTGVGDALVEALLVWARAEGLAAVVLEVADDNGQAVRFYERLGFARNGVTSALPPPREHIREHQRVLVLR